MLKPIPRVNRSGEQDGSGLTVRTLFESEETPLLRYAFSLVGRREVAEEIVQEVFLQLSTHWDTIDSPRAWLFRSVRNGVYNYIRDHRREILRCDEIEMKPDGAENESPEVLLVRIEAIGALRGILDELDETDRELVQLKYFDGLKYRDISERTGLSIGNVGYRLHHILKELAHQLRPHGIDEIP